MRGGNAVGVHPLLAALETGPHLGRVGDAVTSEGEEAVPERREPPLVGVAVLCDQRRDPRRMAAGDAKPDRRSMVLHVQGEAVEAELVEQPERDVGERVERVGERVRRRHRRVAEAEVIGGDDVVVAGELGDQLAEHERARWESVQQHDRRAGRVTGLPVEDLVGADLLGAITGDERGHRTSFATGEWVSLDDESARKQVVEAADRLFYEHGIRSVGMAQIRDAAVVSLKRLYQLFPAKDHVAAAALHQRDLDFRRALRAHVAPLPTPLKRILGVFDFLHLWFAEPDFRGCPFVNAYGETATGSDCVLEVVTEQKRALRAYLVDLALDAGRTADLGDQLLLLANGAMVTAAMLHDPTAALHAKQAAAQLLNAPAER
jgi:AcrR family transcriptional regulator